MKKIVEIKNLVHEYARRDSEGNVAEIVRAVDSVNLEIEPGAFVAVLGENGSGKSTLAKHLNALLMPTEGTVLIDGKNTEDREKLLDIRKTAGMVFQNPDNQIVANVVEEDVAFGPENLGVPTEKLEKRVHDSLKAVDLFEERKKSPNRLSGGQKQRAAIAGILAMRSKCIILDEATAMLDPVGRKQVLQAVLELNREEHITVILITHFMEEVIEADQIFVMKQGEVVLSGTPRQVFSRKELLEECGLTLPDAARIAWGLKLKGLSVRTDVLSMQELEEELNGIGVSHGGV